ncbi:hypothetical protein C0989_003950 [Termitomyces sp. Mn162]|nr:hypothetical protein C0989_003950 [Termitomyces sp. Mn162]
MMVHDYVGELQELFTIVGSTNSKEKVVKLFNGFRTSIQRELYCMGLNPETSRWKKVVSKAEFVEMAEPEERKRLTKEEEEQFQAQDRCFNCGEMSRPGKPPGVKSYSVRLDLREADRLREEVLGQTTEGLSVGMVLIETSRQVATDQSTHPPSQEALGSESLRRWTQGRPPYPKRPRDKGEDAGDYYDPVELIPPWEFGEEENPIWVDNSEEKLALVYEEERKFGRPRRLGNALERRLDHFLEWLQPYPGDPENVLQYRGRRFTSTQTEEGVIHTWDAVWEQEATIPCEWVTNPSFEVGTWYGLEQSVETGVPLTRSSWYGPTLLTNVWAWNAEKVLELGNPYLPSEDKIYHKIQPRFCVVREGLGTCLVVDRQIRFVASIRAEHLENPRFDVCGWYAKRVKRAFPKADSSIWEEDKPFDLGCTVVAGSETPISQEELAGKGERRTPPPREVGGDQHTGTVWATS